MKWTTTAICGTSKQNINKYHDPLGRWQMNILCISWKQISFNYGFPPSAAKYPYKRRRRRSVIPVIGKTESGRLLGFLFSAIWTECQQIVHMESWKSGLAFGKSPNPPPPTVQLKFTRSIFALALCRSKVNTIESKGISQPVWG